MEQWIQVYDPMGRILLSALGAAVPLFLLFYLLAIKRLAGYKAAGLCCLSAFVLSVTLWDMPLLPAVHSLFMGMGFGLFPIVWIIVAAVWIYNMTVESKEFDKIRHSLASLTDDRRLQAILIAFAFNAFLEGAAGFGTPVAISAAMLVGLGFKPFYAAGICLVANSAPAAFVAGLISSIFMPGYGLIKGLKCFFRTVFQLKLSILTICLVLGLAYIMNYSGMSSTLGLAFTQTGALFPFFAPIIGWVGVFLTGSDTSANALFSSLQRTTGEALGVDPNLMVAVNSSGGVTGKMISPQSISISAAATNQSGREGDLFRFALKHSLIMLLMICLITFAQSHIFK